MSLLDILDDVAVSTITEFLQYKYYTVARQIFGSADTVIFNPSYLDIPSSRVREYFNYRQFTNGEIWEFIGCMISRKLYIGNLKSNSWGCSKISDCILKAIIVTYKQLINDDPETWFLRNCDCKSIYKMISANEILRLAPITTVVKCVKNVDKLIEVYGNSDEIYAHAIKYCDGSSDLSEFDLIDISTVYPLLFAAFVERALLRTYVSTFDDAYPNIEAAIVHHLHTTAGMTLSKNGEVYYKKKKNIEAINCIISNHPDTCTPHRIYAAYLVSVEKAATIHDLYIHTLKYALMASKHDRDLINGILRRLDDESFEKALRNNAIDIHTYV